MCVYIYYIYIYREREREIFSTFCMWLQIHKNQGLYLLKKA